MERPNQGVYYLQQLQKAGVIPSFWMSEEYFAKAELTWAERDGYEGWMNDVDSFWLFPPLRNGEVDLEANYWAGFPGCAGRKFIDHQFIYDPLNFDDLSGKDWKVFRRNIRKASETGFMEYRPMIAGEEEDHLTELVLNWAEGEEVYDPETMIKFVLYGENRFGLWRDGVLVGVNVADTNWMFTNFRFCFDMGEPKLNEYLRWLFYQSEWVRESGKLVNDGGSLGSEGLERYKRKLNPVEIMEIRSTLE